MKRTVQTGTITAIDEGGMPHTLAVFTTFVHSRPLIGPESIRPDMKTIRTENGSPVNLVEKGKYEVVATGQRLFSDDPDAL